MHWGLKEWTYPSLCLQGGSNITGSCLNNEYLQLRYVNGVKCLLQQTTFSIFGVFPTFIGYHLLNYFSNNSVLCFLQFLHWERGLVLHSEPRCDRTHSGIWSIQQLLGRSEQTLLLCIDLLSHYNIFFLQVIVINLHVIQQVFFLCVCSRAGIVCGCLWERKLQRLFQSHKWWCAWTAPQTSASLFGDTTATAAEEWVTRKTNTVLLKHFNICETGCKIYFNVYLILSVVNLCCLMQIVCRSCSRNRYPLKYMKDRMAKVCDHCYNELKKRGGKTLHFWNLSSACFSVCLSYF